MIAAGIWIVAIVLFGAWLWYQYTELSKGWRTVALIFLGLIVIGGCLVFYSAMLFAGGH